MNQTHPKPSQLQRWIIGSGSILLAVTIVVWAWEASRLVMQFAFILAAFALCLLAVLSVAAWRHGFRWFLTRGALRFYGWLVVGIVSVIVLFYAEENWRGKRAWAALQREAAARGESLELSSVIPAPVPDDENFALAPGMPELFDYSPGGERSRRYRNRQDLPFYLGNEPRDYPEGAAWTFPAGATWALQQETDLSAWQKFLRRRPLPDAAPVAVTEQVTPEPQTPAADVLLALSRYGSSVAVLRAAAQRPKARYPLPYEKGLPGLHWPDYLQRQNLPAAARVLCLRAAAELAQEQNEAALQDSLLALRLADSLGHLPYQAAQGTRQEMLVICLQPVWEGIVRRRWNEQQLAVLQQQLEATDLLAEWRRAARGDTLMTMNLADQLQAYLDGRSSPMADEMRSARGDDLLPVWLFRLFYPTGWLYQDKAWVYRLYERWSKALELGGRDDMGSRWQFLSATDPCLLIFVVPKLKETFGTSDQTLFLQTACHQAAAACALERCRLAEGQYPASLEALVPKWLKQVPADLMDSKGAPLRYRQEGKDGFVLYSIGWNGQDDQGTPGSANKDWHGVQDEFPKLNEGDWVWRQLVR